MHSMNFYVIKILVATRYDLDTITRISLPPAAASRERVAQ